MNNLRRLTRGACCAALALLTGCVPRIEVATPKEPITINMNVKIEHDIRIQADQAATPLLEEAGRNGDDAKKSAPAGAQ
ncbi:YnbE family lipoprotein [Affinibrenneria salicis]|uniref:YnbE family lipoprotein n=1 Tax=Affinibrenneria salicis TaxID=2590031 RepID=A0A5J5G4P8_9GAMM|nr:YnbE family lipoprotein [Affinibrenneria salicis]KAA9001978.1 YnbE family lipoprotein [Affinibrenneria salicis]